MAVVLDPFQTIVDVSWGFFERITVEYTWATGRFLETRSSCPEAGPEIVGYGIQGSTEFTEYLSWAEAPEQMSGGRHLVNVFVSKLLKAKPNLETVSVKCAAFWWGNPDDPPDWEWGGPIELLITAYTGRGEQEIARTVSVSLMTMEDSSEGEQIGIFTFDVKTGELLT